MTNDRIIYNNSCSHSSSMSDETEQNITISFLISNKMECFLNYIRLLSVSLLLCLVFCAEAQTWTLCDQWVSCGNGVELLDPYYDDGVTFEWTGSAKNGKAHGKGTAIKYKNGVKQHTYVGEYQNGIRQGKGQITYYNGDVSFGTFINGQLTGKGVSEFENGQRFEGEFINYRPHGYGKMTEPNGAHFEGIVASQRVYTGKFTDYDGTVTYYQKGYPVAAIKQEPKSNYSPKIGTRVTEYFDKDWNRCKQPQAAYYRLITYEAPHKPNGVVKDYYITGELQGEQTPVYIDYDDEELNFIEGEVKWYHKNGKMSKRTYFLNNKPNGPEEEWNEQGAMESRRMYEDGVLNGDAIDFFPNGSPQRVMKYKDGQLHNNKFLEVAPDGESAFLVYYENFVWNAQAWVYDGPNGVSAPNMGNFVTMQVVPGRTVSGGIDTGLSPTGYHVIEGLIHNPGSEKCAAGMLFGFKDWNNYCAVYIVKGAFAFDYVKRGKRLVDEQWVPSKVVNDSVNEVRIANGVKSTDIYINDEMVAQYERIYFDGSFCGFTTMNITENEVVQADFANLIVYEAIDPERIPSEYLPASQSVGSKGGWTASGSGFFISEDGYLATNHHVVDGATTIEVSFVRDGQWVNYPASVVMSDKQNDLSILKIAGSSFQPMPTIPYNFVTRVQDTGSEVFTLGYPMADVMGNEVKFTDGKISSKSGIQGDATVYQMTVPIQPGNSGGPLFNMDGSLVGITSSTLNREYFRSENVNYAIKSSYLKALVERLPQHIELQTQSQVAGLPLVEKIKRLENYMIFIKVK